MNSSFLISLIGFALGIFVGLYVGSRRLRRLVNRMIRIGGGDNGDYDSEEEE